MKNRVFPGVELRDKKAGLLFQLMRQHDTRVGLERSFKFFQTTLLPDRFSIRFQSKALGQEPDERILNICRQIDMSADLLQSFQDCLPDSDIVLFGFEQNQNNSIYKAYLEFADRIGEAIKQNPDYPGPVVVHKGFEWDTSDRSPENESMRSVNAQSSFDFNLYPANLRFGELYPLLLQICGHYAIPYREFNKVYEP